jgi:hypothetical protein
MAVTCGPSISLTSLYHMETPEEPPAPEELPRRARRAVRIIYLGMAIFILLPFLLVWLTGSIRF